MPECFLNWLKPSWADQAETIAEVIHLRPGLEEESAAAREEMSGQMELMRKYWNGLKPRSGQEKCQNYFLHSRKLCFILNVY